MSTEKLVEEAREFVSKSHVGRVTARELDHAILLLRRMVDAADRSRPAIPAPPRGNPELDKVLASLGIDPNAVIDASTEVSARYMWRTEAAWPAGGTYEADVPRNSGDKMVAQRLTTKATIDIVGRHPDGVELPSTSEDYTRSRIETIDHGDWTSLSK